jgi:type I restriction-modification system DNA methylase subunit
MLPMTVLRRFDCVLAPTKDKVLREFEKRKGGRLNDEALDKFLNRAAGQRFHNHSPLTFEKLIRRFNELANETAGDHFTPREVIRLMVNLLFINDDTGKIAVPSRPEWVKTGGAHEN